jgi:hypothetical protein
LLGARQGVLVVTDLVESVKAVSGARVRSRCARVSWMAWLSWPLWALGHEKTWSPKGSRSLPQEHLVLMREEGGWGGVGGGGRQNGRCRCQGGDCCVVGRG